MFYVVINIAYIINMLHSPILKKYSSHKILYKSEPDFSQLKVFYFLYFFNSFLIYETNFDH